MNIEESVSDALRTLERHAPDAGHVASAVRRGAAVRRRRRTAARLTVAGAATAAAGIATVALVSGTATPTARQAAAPTTPAALKAAILTAYDKVGGLIEYDHYVYSGGLTMDQQMWVYPFLPRAGQQVLFRDLVAGQEDQAVAYTQPASGTAHHATTVTEVNYGSRTWAQGVVFSRRPAHFSSDNIAIVRSLLTQNIYSITGRTTLHGRDVLVLTLAKGQQSLPSTIWIDAHSYLPVHAQYTQPGSAPGSGTVTVTLDVTFLPPTSQNLANLRADVPSGFTRDQAMLTAGPAQAPPAPSPSS
jgi:hypothetical protein